MKIEWTRLREVAHSIALENPNLLIKFSKNKFVFSTRENCITIYTLAEDALLKKFGCFTIINAPIAKTWQWEDDLIIR